jgi:hypothetical protein
MLRSGTPKVTATDAAPAVRTMAMQHSGAANAIGGATVSEVHGGLTAKKHDWRHVHKAAGAGFGAPIGHAPASLWTGSSWPPQTCAVRPFQQPHARE